MSAATNAGSASRGVLTTATAPAWPLVGHQRAVSSLQHAIASGRVAHAYLVVGPPGVGKRSFALALAQTLNCLSATPAGQAVRVAPCGVCPNCQRIAASQHPDVLYVDPASQRAFLDGSKYSRSTVSDRAIIVDTAREIRDQLTSRPYEAKYKLAILGGAETMRDEAANALLKTLEEPRRDVVIVLLAPNEGSVLATIRSRCQLLTLRPLPRSEIEAALGERGVEAAQGRLLAALSEGRPGWAIAAATDPTAALQERADDLAQVIALSRRGAATADRFNYAARLATDYGKGATGRASVYAALDQWQGWWRDLLLIIAGQGQRVTNVDRTADLQAQATKLSPDHALAVLTAIRTARSQLDANVNPRLVLEGLMLGL